MSAVRNSLESGRLRRELVTMQCMVRIYCAAHHGTGGSAICADCAGFLAYAGRRLVKCPYGPAKPTCTRCPVHCYKSEPRLLASAIMKYAGPRMAWRHPWLSVVHLFDRWRSAEHPLALRRRDGA